MVGNQFWQTAGWLALSLGMQSFVMFQLPSSEGFTRIGPTAAMIMADSVSLFALSRLIFSGAKLSVIIPLIAAAVPLAAVMLGIIIFQEKASLQKTLMLASACIMVGLANRFG